MTEAAFKACYSEWRMIKTRATVQLVFEIPIEQADAAYQALGGMPIAAKEVWCAIARMIEPVSRQLPPAAENKPGAENPSPPSPTPLRADKIRQKWATMPYAKQVVLRGQEPIFWAFLREMCAKKVSSEEEAAQAVREICCVNSRADIKPETEAETYWLDLEKWFDAWKVSDRVSA